MIEFVPFGLLAGVPIGFGFFVLARWKRRSEKAWGLAMWALAALWITGATALPSIAGGSQNRDTATLIIFATAASFLLQLVLAAFLVLSRRPGPDVRPVSTKRLILLIATLGGLVVLSLLFAVW